MLAFKKCWKSTLISFYSLPVFPEDEFCTGKRCQIENLRPWSPLTAELFGHRKLQCKLSIFQDILHHYWNVLCLRSSRASCVLCLDHRCPRQGFLLWNHPTGLHAPSPFLVSPFSALFLYSYRATACLWPVPPLCQKENICWITGLNGSILISLLFFLAIVLC